ncbi:MAG TPA: prephenate dehydrogenase [Levilinea sp.]|nr:prephenate dehydrogenase [Levilinea sp.]
MTVRMTIIGLGQTGASIGLALAAQKRQVMRIGHDRSPEIARQAKKLGAVDDIAHNLHAAVETADVVILAIPVDEVRETLDLIAEDLRPNALVIDTSPLKTAVSAWAQELLPPGRFFITFTLSINPAYLHETAAGIEAAHADLFQNSLAMITSRPGANPDVVNFAADLATLLGCKPLFTDSYESDGLMAATSLLPQLLAAAMVNATAGQPGWVEARKFAGKEYAQATEPVAHLADTQTLGQAYLQNRENVVRVMDNLLAALRELRQAIVEDEDGTLHALLHNARDDRRIWLEQRQSANWNPALKMELPRSSDVFGRLFGLGRRRPDKRP